MLALAKEVRKIEDPGYALYADITLSATKGSLAQEKTVLQEAAMAVERFAPTSGMRYSPEKPEGIRLHGLGIYKSRGHVDFYLEGHNITESNKSKILGFVRRAA
ncbi:hypothetical protein HPB49_010007 [Dermacentor silvarum]|uniref:Uncharacterized protein n=1 Tax=Dermacentor silvarum TaxID=543639 RepID=A0ACB8DIQ8_DERSI|nr:hypothetical protein HPB49_010007 [Dermacentor silvarum]